MRRAARPPLAPIVPLLAFLVLAGGPSASAATVSPAGSVVVVEIDGSIDRVQAGYLTDSLDQAETDGSTVVIQLDSAGTGDGGCDGRSVDAQQQGGRGDRAGVCDARGGAEVDGGRPG